MSITFKHKPERRIQDYPHHRIEFPDPRKHGTPPFTDEAQARRYLKAIANFSDKDMLKLLAFYLPTLYPCGCPNDHEDNLYGTGKRSQLLCDDGHYRCLTCGYERNEDGSKYSRKQRVSDVDTNVKKMDKEQLSLLEWKSKDEND